MAIVDQTPECSRAVLYAGYRARNTGGGVVLMFAVPPQDFQQWLGVGDIMREEAMEEANAALAKTAQFIREKVGIEPELVIREGQPVEQIHALIEEDRDIAILVLASGSTKEGPGPLVSSVAGRSAAFPIPVTVIPDALSDEEIEALS